MKLRIRTRRFLLALASAGAASALAVYMLVSAPVAVQRLDHLLFDDIVRRNENPEAANPRIVRVDVDDASFDWVTRELNESWPWPREFHGVMAVALRSWGASVVGFDFIFDQAGSGTIDDLTTFRDALREAGSVVLAVSAASMDAAAAAPSAGFGLELAGYGSVDEAIAAAALASAVHLSPFLIEEGERVRLFVAGYEDPSSAAGYLSTRHYLLDEFRPDLMAGAGGTNGRAFRERIAERLLDEIGPVPGGAIAFDPRALVASRFALGPASRVAPLIGAYSEVLLPVAPVLPEIAGIGFVDHVPDLDGIVRRASLLYVWEDQVYPSLSLSLALFAIAETGDEVPEIALDRSRLRVGDGVVPVEKDGRALIRFLGSEPYKRVPAWQVLDSAARVLFDGEEPTFDTSIFEGAVVLVAPVASGLMDFQPTPINNRHLGPDIVAATVDNILGWLFIRRAPPWTEALWASLLAFLAVFVTAWVSTRAISRQRGGIFGVLRFAFRTLFSLTGAVAGIAAAYFLAVVLYSKAGVWMGAAVPVISAGLSVVLFVAGGEFLERRDRRQIHDALGTYTSRAVADLIASEGVEALAPRRAEVSVYFSDIAGFTSFSEKMPPEALAELLNIYLTEMTEVILARDGIVDKYIGDAIMAFWGAPAEQPDHAFSAVACGLKMQARLAEIAPELELKYGVRLVVRAGVNSGQVAVGNMGSAHKVNYTLMGDTVNLGARLEGANKSYDTFLMVGEETWGRLGGRITGRELDLLQVKGKDLPVRVYEPLTLADEVPAERLTWLRKWEEALDAYRQRRFDEAKGLFQEIRRLRGEDGPSRVYLSRCEHFLEHPPPEGWDGAFVMTSK